uniref:Uncharacterized protein n=1 Tax=Anas platyrhynchos TaxID=8839 RepID=A0A8B9TJP4_ANAPL
RVPSTLQQLFNPSAPHSTVLAPAPSIRAVPGTSLGGPIYHLPGHLCHQTGSEAMPIFMGSIGRSPEMHRVSYAVSLHDLPARPTAFNRVLQQIRSRPSIKRGTSLHSGSRRAKSGSLEPQKGSPHLVRKAPQDSSLTAILHQHQGRPRSSSTTDTAILLAESGAVYLLTEDTESLADKVGL